MRLGFSIRVLGTANLPACDPRPGADLSTGLAYLRDILLYLQANGIHFYRMHSGLIPHALAQEPARLAEEMARLAPLAQSVAQLAQSADIRLTFHPYSAVVLNTPNEEQAAQAIARLAAHIAWLDALGLGPESVVVLHVGGVYGDPQASLERFARRYESLPEPIRRRVSLENDDHRYSFANVRTLHQRHAGAPVFDVLHHQVHNPERTPLPEALADALHSWPAGVVPKLHFSTPRTDLKQLEGSGRIKLPTWTEHADFVNPFCFLTLLQELEALPDTDIMLEAKARDVALIKLRQDVARFAPEWSSRLS